MRVRALCFLLLPFSVQAQHNFRVLHAFGNGSDGAGVYDSVTLDANGNVYGSTAGGGAHKDGIVFRLTPGPKGYWKETILHTFPSSAKDGAGPRGGVVLAQDGTLYGTTQVFGKNDRGVAFSLTPTGDGWREAILYSFCSRQGCEDGGEPWGNLVLDSSSGNIFGTGFVAFELSPGRPGWKNATLHNFTGKNGDGYLPLAGPIRDGAGNFYGTTNLGGGSKNCDAGCGTVWELSPPSWDTQGWTEHILHAFGVDDTLGFPETGQLARDGQGNLYGTTATGGPLRGGAVFKLAPPPSGFSGEWKETILHGFGEDQNGYLPEGGVIFDDSGNLYGTTGLGGAGCGVVFKLSPQSDGSWKYTLLHTFLQSDGCSPGANLTFGPDGKLYGTTTIGGTYGGGVVFQLTP